jgi:hypothetical protein
MADDEESVALDDEDGNENWYARGHFPIAAEVMFRGIDELGAAATPSPPFRGHRNLNRPGSIAIQPMNFFTGDSSYSSSFSLVLHMQLGRSCGGLFPY